MRRVTAGGGVPARTANPWVVGLVALAVAVAAAGCGDGGSLTPFAGVPARDPTASPVTFAPSPAVSTPSPHARSPDLSQPPAAPLPEGALFGFAGHLMWDEVPVALRALDMLAEDGMDVVRFDVSWQNMEPRRGTYRYLDKLDAIVDGARERGLLPIIVVIETPAWANRSRGAWVPPDDPGDYARFTSMLANRYRGRVAAWEIWNEPDLRLFWRPDPSAADYVELLLAASRAIREADPTAIVVAAGATFGNLTFVQGLYDAGARGAFDALAVHPYPLWRSPDDESDRYHSFTAVLDDVHALLRANGDDDVPIWVTELGWATSGANSTTRTLQARYLARSVDLVRERPWVGVLAAYTIDVRHSVRLGLSENGQRSASWRAYVEAVRQGA